MKLTNLFTTLLLQTFLFSTANAGVIISATDATIDLGGPGYGLISETYDQSGLYNPYISGITDFDEYISSNPFHTSDYNGNEWFSREYDSPEGIASVTYDLGFRTNIDAIALWNEESSGITFLSLFGSLDGINFFDMAQGLMPQDNPFDESRPDDDYSYAAEVFNLSNSYTRYVRFSMSGCPQQPSSFNYCSIGEVAFRTADNTKPTEVPEPSTWSIFMMSMIGLGMKRKYINS
ncbi:PEP-CTERM sorting domain-containing protein [Colwellia sp. 1_MG-2023]|uniref:PEP-CTERM sorting domain-containing protein n=1 Tax=Colwellia sp. 1_MG-2023 TaxID=3062649 RepID=UPI0026E44CDD|nr:PEP-CTERM sorting domain-containing protein [Colwellia sp. 1_MG-2023]MDO6447375.1 PEP-CTERM sorting domain-containing protein [Colwellia sp. 1_MG-2023]